MEGESDMMDQQEYVEGDMMDGEYDQEDMMGDEMQDGEMMDDEDMMGVSNLLLICVCLFFECVTDFLSLF